MLSNFFLQSRLIKKREYMPLPAGIFEFIGYQTVIWNQMMAASLVGIIPVFDYFFFFCKNILWKA